MSRVDERVRVILANLPSVSPCVVGMDEFDLHNDIIVRSDSTRWGPAHAFTGPISLPQKIGLRIHTELFNQGNVRCYDKHGALDIHFGIEIVNFAAL